MIHDNEWAWPPARSDQLVNIEAAPSAISCSEFPFRVVFEGSSSGTFRQADAWALVRNKKQQVPWNRLIWFNLNVLKLALTSWLAMINKPATQDRIGKWGSLAN